MKLKITILALGFATQKELYRHFLAVAPTSGLEQESFYKWIQGRSTPRSSKFYEHWAAMLQLERLLAYLKSCSIEEFAEDMIGSYGLDRAVVASVLPNRASLHAKGRDPSDDPGDDRCDHLCSTFACYSHCFSPIFKGKIMRGALVISASDPTARPKVRYIEITPFNELNHRGRLSGGNRLITLDLHDDRNNSHVHLILHAPSAPASVLTGLMTGSSFHDASPQPTVTRFLAIRVPGVDLSALGGRDCVFDMVDHSISAELIGCGLPIVEPAKLDRVIADFLNDAGRGGFDQISVDASARLNFALDLELANAATKSERDGEPSVASGVVLPLSKKAHPRR